MKMGINDRQTWRMPMKLHSVSLVRIQPCRRMPVRSSVGRAGCRKADRVSSKFVAVIAASRSQNKKAIVMKRTSKFLSLVLRHEPEKIGLTLDAAGWVDVSELIAKCNAAGQALDAGSLAEIVRTSDKQRFTLSEDGTRIRAAQGHSVAVELGLTPTVPPDVLYHGTASTVVAAIRAEGLKPGSRQQVHLSADTVTARRVGARHGAPVVLTITAQRMHMAGHTFTQADNGVWLTDYVPPRFIEA
jgi:putative RNA 2'-phosphotransferase